MLDSSDAGDYAETDPSGRYGRFNEVLGKGAMKTVYRAFDELNGLEVAWNQAKLCNVMRSPDALQRMYSEVHLLGTLNHKSIIRFYTSWVDPKNQTFNFITELFTSGTLRQYRQRYRRVDIRAVKNWACQILHGLVYLHGHDPPVIHRDLKCDNIFVNGHLGQVKIGDLGLAAVLRGTQNAHSVIGTPEFMAPELYEEDYNQLVDIYSFGMCVLEMLTSEYPYSECSNPAQIYKKVTSGKLPHGFHRVQDPEAKRFIYRCLQNVSMRSSASELLLDPFLMFNEPRRNPNLLLTGTETHRTEGGHGRLNITSPARPADMTITGKMNPEDEKIELNVQISDKHGSVRRIQFPFDILSDTPIDVANEMVKELEITDRDPSEIAEVIRQEILYLVPDWNAEEPPEQWLSHQVYSYGDDGLGHPFYSSSSPTSSHFSDIGANSSHGEHGNHADWLQSGMFSDDDDTSSMNSGKFSATYYLSADADEQVNPAILRAQAIPKNQKFTRFGPEDGALAAKFSEQCSVGEPESSSGGSTSRGGKKGVRALMRNRSMVDIRSQLLNRTLVEGLKKRLFKTVGAVEHIGFRMPADEGSRRPPTSPKGDRKKGLMWGRG